MRIRPDELAGIRAGVVDLGFRRWDRPRVVVGTRMRTPVGLVEVTSVEAAQIVWDAIHGAVTIEQASLMRVPDADRNFDLLLDVTIAGLRHAGQDRSG